MNIKNKAQFIEYFIKGSKQVNQLKIGVEHERFLFEGKEKKRISYSKLKKIFNNLKKKGWEPILEKENIIGLKRGKQQITTEPGFQCELSGAPLEDIHQVCHESSNYLKEIKEASHGLNINTASIGFDKRFQRSKLDAIGRPPPPADILDFKTGVTPADQFYASHTIHVDYAGEFRDRPTRKRWPGSKIQVYPIAAMESDYGRALPAPREEKRAPRTSVAERQRYVCRFAQCKCAFSRKYTLQLHERTHLYGQDHYFWKHAPKIGQGADNIALPGNVQFGENGSVTMEDSKGLTVKRKKGGAGRSSGGALEVGFKPRRKKRGGGKKKKKTKNSNR